MGRIQYIVLLFGGIPRETGTASPSRGKAMNPLRKINCWEFRKCGRQPGGRKVEERGVCPAAVDFARDGTYGGRNGGRCCWTVAGTYCFGEVQGTFAKKFKNCMECDFFWLVANEEEDFVPSAAFPSASRV